MPTYTVARPPSLGTACPTRAQLGTQQIHFHLHLRLNPPSTIHNPVIPIRPAPASTLTSPHCHCHLDPPKSSPNRPLAPRAHPTHLAITSTGRGHHPVGTAIYPLFTVPQPIRRRISSHPHDHHLTLTPAHQRTQAHKPPRHRLRLSDRTRVRSSSRTAANSHRVPPSAADVLTHHDTHWP